MSTFQNIYRKSVLKKYLQRLYKSPFLQQRRFITFFIFLILSACLWFVRSLGEEYETQVDYPVRYINFPEDKVLVGFVPDKLQLTVRAKGFSILKSKMNFNQIPIQFNVSSFSLNNIGADTFYIVTETAKEVLSAELSGMTIINISPDTLYFKLTNIGVRKVSVMPVLDMHEQFFQQQFMLNGKIEVSPDSIIISGPKPLVDSIHYIPTEALRYSNLTDTIIGAPRLKAINMITFSQTSVKVVIPVDRFTEVENQLPVVPINVPDSLNMIAIPGQITVTYRICLSNYNKVINNPLIPRIDYNALQLNSVNRLTVFIVDTPRFISNLRFNPREIEFLITRK